MSGYVRILQNKIGMVPLMESFVQNRLPGVDVDDRLVICRDSIGSNDIVLAQRQSIRAFGALGEFAGMFEIEESYQFIFLWFLEKDVPDHKNIVGMLRKDQKSVGRLPLIGRKSTVVIHIHDHTLLSEPDTEPAATVYCHGNRYVTPLLSAPVMSADALRRLTARSHGLSSPSIELLYTSYQGVSVREVVVWTIPYLMAPRLSAIMSIGVASQMRSAQKLQAPGRGMLTWFRKCSK
nr:hypothetical protein CFP56_16713 [Quercus suber]